MLLPPALRPWSQSLSHFPLDIVQVLGPMVAQLASWLGPLQHKPNALQGEPDGYNGLHTQGHYDQLLSSEWLLADEMPDEFMRRASMKEHLFLKPAFQQPHQTKQVIVLFNLGPSQLGTPRLAHIALMIVLARQAELADAQFAWGILQETELHTEFTPQQDITYLLNKRFNRDCHDQQLSAWKQYDSIKDNAATVHWIGTNIQALGHINVIDPLLPGINQLQLQHQQHQLSLALPEMPLCTRILRAPFNQSTRKIHDISHNILKNSPLVFSRFSNRLFAHSQHKITALAIPNINAKPGKPKYINYLDDEYCYAIGSQRKRILGLFVNKKYLIIKDNNHILRQHSIEQFNFDPPSPPHNEKTLSPLIIWKHDAFNYFAFITPSRQLFIITQSNANHISDNVYASIRTAHSLMYCCHQQDKTLLRQINDNGSTTNDITLANHAVLRIIMARSDSENHNITIAIEHSTHHWTIYQPYLKEAKKFTLKSNQVIGVIPYFQSVSCCLISLDPDKKSLIIHFSDTEDKCLYRSTHRISQAIVADTQPIIACLTETGEIFIYSIEYQTILTQFLPNK